jgi:hypothetical protein
MQDDRRILLVRPSSGLVDILNQVVTSHEWAQMLSRDLVIDCLWGNWSDDLSYYFDVRSPYSARISLCMGTEPMERLHVHPPLLADLQDRSYRRRLVRDDANMLRISHAETGMDLSAYNVPDCRADVIVHHPIGGGERATEALRMFVAKPELRNPVMEAMNDLPRPFNAIHLRNTDLVASLDTASSQIALLDPAVPIVVASDSATSIVKISELCPDHRFFQIAQTLSAGREPLHFDESVNPRQRNIEALVDLFVLASSETLVLPEIVSGPKLSSGYSRLARELHEDAELVDGLLFGGDSGDAPHVHDAATDEAGYVPQYD